MKLLAALTFALVIGLAFGQTSESGSVSIATFSGGELTSVSSGVDDFGPVSDAPNTPEPTFRLVTSGSSSPAVVEMNDVTPNANTITSPPDITAASEAPSESTPPDSTTTSSSESSISATSDAATPVSLTPRTPEPTFRLVTDDSSSSAVDASSEALPFNTNTITPEPVRRAASETPLVLTPQPTFRVVTSDSLPPTTSSTESPMNDATSSPVSSTPTTPEPTFRSVTSDTSAPAFGATTASPASTSAPGSSTSPPNGDPAVASSTTTAPTTNTLSPSAPQPTFHSSPTTIGPRTRQNSTSISPADSGSSKSPSSSMSTNQTAGNFQDAVHNKTNTHETSSGLGSEDIGEGSVLSSDSRQGSLQEASAGGNGPFVVDRSSSSVSDNETSSKPDSPAGDASTNAGMPLTPSIVAALSIFVAILVF